MARGKEEAQYAEQNSEPHADADTRNELTREIVEQAVQQGSLIGQQGAARCLEHRNSGLCKGCTGAEQEREQQYERHAALLGDDAANAKIGMLDLADAVRLRSEGISKRICLLEAFPTKKRLFLS